MKSYAEKCFGIMQILLTTQSGEKEEPVIETKMLAAGEGANEGDFESAAGEGK